MTEYRLRLALVAAGTLALAACGDTDDASLEAEADTVEIPADEAMAGVRLDPVPDPQARDLDFDPVEEVDGEADAEAAEAAGERAQDVAADAIAAAGDMEEDTEAVR